MRRAYDCLFVCAVSVVVTISAVLAQEPARPEAVSTTDFQAAVDRLGDFDYPTRVTASRLVRRTPAAQAVPALVHAVNTHKEGYVRYRALVLLTGFKDPQTPALMQESLRSSNDRVRTVAYAFFEHHPEPSMVPVLLESLGSERSEFVRPALVRALAAHASDRRAQQALVGESSRGEDFFRSAVIEALGEYRAGFAYDAIAAIARLDGPLQDDAALALGRIGDKRALTVLATLQRTAERGRQPAVAAAICLLGINCETHEKYLVETLTFADRNPGYQDLLRGSAAGLGAIAVGGRRESLLALLERGLPSRDPTRAPIALAIATVALRNTPLMLSVLETYPNRKAAIDLLAEGFDMLEEDLSKEMFFTLVRRTYWSAADSSPTRGLMQELISALDF